MTRRTVASVVAVVLLVALVGAAWLLPVPYVTMSPGPTVDVFAEQDGRPVISVTGARTYPTRGDLRLTTVSVTSPGRRITLAEALSAWFDQTRAVYPREVIYPPDRTAEEVERESDVQMVSSQDTAIAVALRQLGYELPLMVEVRTVSRGAPAEGRLRPGDVIVSVNGTVIEDVEQVSREIQGTGVDRPTTFVVRRDGATHAVRVQARADEDDPERAVVGIEIATTYGELPVDVRLQVDEKIGGPSAGLVFSLAVYDVLTPGALTGGAHVAGTGSLDDDGRVGAIGGVQQKIVAAADAGAELFLVPAGNCPAALGADVRAEEIRLVRVETMPEALAALERYAADPDADLPDCEGA